MTDPTPYASTLAEQGTTRGGGLALAVTFDPDDGTKGAGMAEIACVRCGEVGEQLARAPLRNELGTRVHESICQRCWDQWLKYQTALINHHGLDVRDQPAREFLMANMEAFLFRSGQADQIDTSKEGQISW